jgi:membrane-associated protein
MPWSLAVSLPSELNAMPTAAAVGVLCAAVIAEIVLMPAVLLPGGTVTLLAGALIGAGRPWLLVALPVAIAVIAGDQVAYFSGAAVTRWWRSRRPGRRDKRPSARRRRMASWFTAAMPSVAAAAGLRYRPFALRAIALRLPWLALALCAGALAADSIARAGHIAGIIGIVVSCFVVACLLAARRRPAP